MKSGDVKSEIWGKSGDTILIYTDFCGYLPGFLCHESRTKNVLQVFHRIVITKEVASCFFVLEKHCKKAVLKFLAHGARCVKAPIERAWNLVPAGQ